MKKQNTRILLAGIIVAALIILTAFRGNTDANTSVIAPNDPLIKEVFTILDTKCNSCHRKQNPFMVFKEKTLQRRASKIYKAVFIEKRMPKGTATNLSLEEYTKLESWLLTQIQD